MKPVDGSQTTLVMDDSGDDCDATAPRLYRGRIPRNPLRRCEDGREARDYLFRTGRYAAKADAPRPGITLLDLNMPGTDGCVVLAKIKGDGWLGSIPVIVMTNSDAKRDIEACYEIGANTYIQKPLNWQGFLEAMGWLQGYWFEIAALPRTDP